MSHSINTIGYIKRPGTFLCRSNITVWSNSFPSVIPTKDDGGIAAFSITYCTYFGCLLHFNSLLDKRNCSVIILGNILKTNYTTPLPEVVFMYIHQFGDSTALIHPWQNCYPERLGKVFLIHVPSIFMKVWKIIYPFIDKNTKQKVRLQAAPSRPL